MRPALPPRARCVRSSARYMCPMTAPTPRVSKENRMHLLKRWRHMLVAAALITVGMLGVPQAASAAPNLCGPWHNQQDMADSSQVSCRETWLVDPGQGNYLTRADLVRAHDLYQSQGFSLPWLWYAPRTTVT